MRKTTMAVAAAAMTLGLATSALAAETVYSEDFSTVYSEDFSTGEGGWVDWPGTITRQPVEKTAAVNGGAWFGFDEIVDVTVWPTDGYVVELDVYLDPAALAVGDGFDYSVSSNRTDGNYLRDFIFHVGVVEVEDERRLLVNGSNNSDHALNSYKLLNDGDGTPTEITTAGWYTLQHVFGDAGDGTLAVDLNVLDAAGDQIFTTTRNDKLDKLADVVGGVNASWVIFTTGDDPFVIDNHELLMVVPEPGDKDDCKSGGWESFDFDNQGQCVASLQANENAGK